MIDGKEEQRGGVATVFISAYHVPARVPFLARMLEAMLDWPFDLVQITLVVNDTALMAETEIAALAIRFATKGLTLMCEVAAPLDHPFHLTWWARRHIPGWIDSARPNRDYFFHLEDDIVLTRENVSYYLAALPVLRAHDLLPGFLRYEVKKGERFALDARFPSPARPRVLGGRTWVTPVFPYWAGYILDCDLARAFMRSKAFDRERSAEVIDWTVRCRAAMGPTWREAGLRRRQTASIPSAACDQAGGVKDGQAIGQSS